MSYEEYDEMEDGFRMNNDDDEPLGMPEEITDLEEDPEDRYH